MSNHPFPVGVDCTLAFGVAVIGHHERVSPLAVVNTVLRDGASDVDVVFVDLIVHDGCSAHGLQCACRRPLPVDPIIGHHISTDPPILDVWLSTFEAPVALRTDSHVAPWEPFAESLPTGPARSTVRAVPEFPPPPLDRTYAAA